MADEISSNGFTSDSDYTAVLNKPESSNEGGYEWKTTDDDEIPTEQGKQSQIFKGSTKEAAESHQTINGVSETLYLKIHSLLLGAAGLISFNVYLSVLDFFTKIYQGHQPVTYFPVAYNAATVFVNLIIGPLSSIFSTRVRIAYSGFILAVLLGSFPLFIYGLGDTLAGYIVFYVHIFITTVFSTFVQCSGFGFAVLLGKSCAGWAGSGMAFGGILVNFMKIGILLVVNSQRDVLINAIFFSMAFIFISGVSASQFVAEKSALTKYHHDKIEEKERKETGNDEIPKVTFWFMLTVLVRIVSPALQMVFIYLVTIGVFPALATQNDLSFFKGNDTWSDIVVVTLYNVMDLAGRMMAERSNKYVSNLFVSVVVYSRVAIVPLFIWASCLESSMKFDIVVLSGTVLLGVTNGLGTNWLLMKTPSRKNLTATMKEPAGFLIVFALVVGLLAGSVAAIILKHIDFQNIF